MGWLMDAWRATERASSVQYQVMRKLQAFHASCDKVEHDALMSGAIPGDFRVDGRFVRRKDGPGLEMRGVLV